MKERMYCGDDGGGSASCVEGHPEKRTEHDVGQRERGTSSVAFHAKGVMPEETVTSGLKSMLHKFLTQKRLHKCKNSKMKGFLLFLKHTMIIKKSGSSKYFWSFK